MAHLHFSGGDVDRHNLLLVVTIEFAILKLVSFLYFARSGRATFARDGDPRIEEFPGIHEGRIWSLPAVL